MFTTRIVILESRRLPASLMIWTRFIKLQKGSPIPMPLKRHFGEKLTRDVQYFEVLWVYLKVLNKALRKATWRLPASGLNFNCEYISSNSESKFKRLRPLCKGQCRTCFNIKKSKNPSHWYILLKQLLSFYV